MASYEMVMPSKFAYYKVRHPYTPSDEYLKEGYLAIEVGDVFEVKRPVKLESGTEEQPEGWLYGLQQRTNEEGFFPANYAEYMKEKEKPIPTPRQKPKTPARSKPHSFINVYFVKPILCAFCKDYIWGFGSIGVKCQVCCNCFHAACKSLAVHAKSSCAGNAQSLPDDETHTDCVPIESWNVTNVIEWMAAVNLYRYSQIFKRYNVDGQKLSALEESQLMEMRIKDEFHVKSILACVEKLCHEPIANKESLVQPEGANKNDHDLIIYTFTSMQPCHLCGEYLWGIIQQGYQCHKCGLCCHRKCSVGDLPRCNIDAMASIRRNSFTHNSPFGVNLSSVKDASPVIISCVTELEGLAKQKGIDLLDAYRRTCSTDDVNALKTALSNDINSSLTSFNEICIAGTLKKFLRDLPVAIIPESHYSLFIELAKKSDDEDVSEELEGLIENLPENHKSTLNYLMKHLVYVYETSHDANKQNALQKLSQIFSQIIIRPPWESIIQVIYNVELQARIVKLLLNCGLYLSSSTPVPVPVLPPRPMRVNQNCPVSPPIPASLIDANYYWGDISRDEVAERMCNTPDGTFMVRNATAKENVTEPFTLTLRKGGCNKLIKIYAKDGKYGLMEPLLFNSVPELIQYYQLHSLAQFNRTLDITLKWPVLKHQPELEPSNDLLAHRYQLEVTIKRHNDLMNQFEELHYRLTEITADQKLKQDALNAFKLTKEMYEEQFLRNDQHKNMVLASDAQKAYDNYELLKKRVRMYEDRTRKIEEAIQQDQMQGREIQLKMNKMKQDLGEILNHRDQLKKKLLDSGESYQNVELILSGSTIISSESTPHEDERTWLIKCDRTTAETMLDGKECGTFLIRPRAESNSYALSIVAPDVKIRNANAIVHCLIDEKESGFGFAEPFYIHETLRDLVMHYKETSLVEHNDTLDVQLMYPVQQSSLYATHVATGPLDVHSRRSNNVPEQEYVH